MILILMALLITGSLALAQKDKPQEEKELTAQEILDQAEALNDPQDQFSNMTMILIDQDQNKKTRELKVWSKGDNKRLIKFLSPADVKGVGFLVLDPDTENERMYLYLPAFKKIRRIAGSAKSGSFMGSDFSYDDIGSTRYSQDYTSRRLKDEGNQYVLELKKKEKSETDYDKLILWISRKTLVVRKVEFYQIKRVKQKKKFELIKVMRVKDLEKIKEYWIPLQIVMENAKKKHTTILKMDEIKVDSGLSNNLFTQRYLQR